MKDIITGYLKRGEVLSGLENCHLPGVFSLVFRERVSPEVGMLRMFYLGRKPHPMNRLTVDGEFSLLPHNHRQDITLFRILGDTCRNVTADFGAGVLLDEYEFGSALNGAEFSLTWRGTRHASFRDERIPEEGYYLPAEAVHTVVASSPCAWVVEEGLLADHTPLCYSLTPHKQLSREGLYKPMTREAIEAVSVEILENLK